MPVPLNHVYAKGGGDICDVLLRVMASAEGVVAQQSAAHIEGLHSRIRSRAQRHDRWQGLAGDIQYWGNEQGNVSIGVPPDSERHDDAMRAEYGDETSPPTGLLRMGMLSGVVDMGWSMQDAFRRSGY